MGAVLGVEIDDARQTCPAARLIDRPDGGVDVLCTVIEEANRREPASMDVPPVVDGAKSPAAILCFCAGQATPGDGRTDALDELRGLTAEEANQRFCYTDCEVWRDERARLERAKTEGVATPFVSSGVAERMPGREEREPDAE